MKRIACACPYVPPELIEACGCAPSRLFPDQGAQERFVGDTEGLCAYARAIAGEAMRAGAWDAVVVTTVCDQMRRVAEVIERAPPLPVFLMHVPSCRESAGALGLYRGELERLGRFLVSLGGAPPDEGRLAQAMARRAEAREALREAGRTMPGSEFFLHHADFLRTGRLALPAQPQPRRREGIPLALVGGPLMEEHLAALRLIEDAGGDVVLDGTDSGERALPAPRTADSPTQGALERLARTYLEGIPHPFQRPNDGLYAWLDAMIAERGVKGIVMWRYVWCDIWHGEVRRLKERSPLPVLDLDVSGGVTCGTERNRLATRISAFLEMIR